MIITYEPRQLKSKQRTNDKFFREFGAVRLKLAQGEDVITFDGSYTVQGLNLKHKRFLERVKDLADNGMMRDEDLEWYELIKCYRVGKTVKNSHAPSFIRLYPFDPAEDVLFEATWGANKGFCERTRELHKDDVLQMMQLNAGAKNKTDIIAVDEGTGMTDAEIEALQQELAGGLNDEVDDDILLGFYSED